jgi:hypothetical protein
MNDTSFAALYCAYRKIDQGDYDKAVLSETLYPHAKWVAPLVRALWPRHFVADHDFVEAVGKLRRFREFFNESEDFVHHPDNAGFLRSTLNLRISSRRMRRLVREVLHPELSGLDKAQDQSVAPFNAEPEKDAAGSSEQDSGSGAA